MADPVFPREVKANLLFGNSFAKNCMKMKKKWTGVGPLGSATGNGCGYD